jgi:Lar family restriction alleviation protein
MNLKPCPFCGGDVDDLDTDVVEDTDDEFGDDLVTVLCPHCLARGPEQHSDEEAIEAWEARDG